MLTARVSESQALGTEDEYLVDAARKAVVISLPEARQTRNRRILVKKTDLSANAVVLTALAGAKIDGVVEQRITVPFESIELESDGTDYFLVRGYRPPGGISGITVRKNTGADIGTRARLNLIEGANVTLTVLDDPGSGEIDITIASTAGGGGSVTSVAGGIGITNAPEPIVGAGTVDLDLHALTTEAAPAAGDFLAIVDVSVGTTPSAQRKVTLANLAVAVEASLGGPWQPFDADLSAVAALATVGGAYRTATNTWALRTLQAPAAGLAITNPAGTLGDPTFALANDLLALENLAGTGGFAARTGADAWIQRSMASGVGVTVVNGDGIAGNPTFDLDINDLTAETALAAGDLLPFLDVSVGTTPAAQRKVTLANLIAAIPAVTSVAGGVGLTGTPDPITTTGTLDIDINSLTTEANIAAADLLAFVDVSVGTGPSATRKIAYTDLVAPVLAQTQPLDAGLTALASLGAGVAVSNGSDTWVARSMASGVGVTVTNGSGVAGDPTFDLDINDLTTETIPVSSDFMPFLDVSVGTTPAAQRKVSIGNLAAALNNLIDHGSLSGLGDDDHSIYLLLAGRNGTANDPILSLNQAGNLYGTTTANPAPGLKLHSTTSAAKGSIDLMDKIRVGPGITSITTSPYNLIDLFPSNLTWDSTGQLRIFNLQNTITVEDNPTSIQVFRMVPTLTTPAGEDRAMGTYNVLVSGVTYAPQSGRQMTGVTLRSINHAPGFSTAGGGASTSTITESTAVRMGGVLNTGWDADDWQLAHIVDPTGSGTISRLGGLHVGITSGRATQAYSLWSENAGVFLAHAGKALFGASQSTLTAPSATMDIAGDLATRRQDVALANGANNDIARTASFIRCTGGGASATITGFTGGADGIWLVVFNDTGAGISLVNDATSTAANRLLVAGGTRNLADQRSAIFLYDTSASRWQEIRPA